MAGFFYFLPKTSLNDLVRKDRYIPEVLRGWKLFDTLSDCEIHPDHMTARACPSGPSGDAGMIICPRPLDGAIGAKGYHPQVQEWRKAEDGSGKWVGWMKDDPPVPPDLLKRQALPCRYVVKDAAGNEWAVVTARSSEDAHVSLPSTYTFKNDKMVNRIKPAFMPLFELSGVLYDHLSVLMTVEQDEGMHKKYLQEEEFLVRAAVQVLCANYRIGIAEAAVLDELNYELLKTETVTAIMMCLVDQPLIEEYEQWLKQKKRSESVPTSKNSSSGQGDFDPITDRADAESLLQS